MRGRTILGFVGDLLVDRDDAATAFAAVQPALDDAHLLFGNLEGPYSDDPEPPPSAPVEMVAGASNLDAFAEVGFDVLSMANNHMVDAGHAAMLETARNLHDQGIATCGAGEDLEAARLPAVLDCGDLQVAYLAYSSVFPADYLATPNTPGVAPMRAYNVYRDAYGDYHAPGAQPIVETTPDQEDLAHLRHDIAVAKEQADFVITSFHWGDFMRPYVLTDHERRTARYSIDLGADMVVGHHHHLLRGMEWYRGKPIMYGLGHFVFDMRADLPTGLVEWLGTEDDNPNYYGVLPRAGWPLMPLHPEARMTAIAWAVLEDDVVRDIGILPCRLQPDGRVIPVHPDTDDGREVVEYLARGCTTQHLNGRIDATGAIELGGHETVRVVPLES